MRMKDGPIRSVVRRRAAGICLLIFFVTPAWADATRFEVRIDVEGELVAPAGRNVAEVRQPIRVNGRFDFVESPATAGDGSEVIRDFTTAAAEFAVDGQSSEVRLGDDASRVHVVRVGTAAMPYLPDAFLSREEHDLLEIPFDPLLVGGLRPATVVAAGATWEVPADVAAGLLAIDTVESGTIAAKVEEISECRGRVAVSGTIDGAIDGVPTHLVIEGTCTIEASPDITSDAESLRYRLDGRFTDAVITVRERRQAGHVAPGFEVTARVSLVGSPCNGAEDEDGTAASAAPSMRRQGPGRPGALWHRDAGGRFDIVHDARWRTVEQASGTCVMRYIDLGALVAQCSITALPPGPESSRPTIEEVQRDIGRSLAGQFERFEGAAESSRSDGVTIIRVVSLGTAESLPFRWVHYVLADASGRRASVAFMMEAAMAERFRDADQALIDGLRLEAGPSPGPAAREARRPRKTAMP